MKKISLKKIKLSRIKKRATASAVAGATVLGIVLGSTFDSPAELLERELLSSRPAVTDVFISDSADDDSGDDDAALAGEEKKKNPRARFKEQVMAMPYYVRACVGLPLWAGSFSALPGIYGSRYCRRCCLCLLTHFALGALLPLPS